MAFLHHDRQADIAKLEQLPVPLRVAFALLVASRMFPAYEQLHQHTGQGDPATVAGLVDRLWQDVQGDPMRDEELDSVLAGFEELIPFDELGLGGEIRSTAEEAASAVGYALRTRQSGEAQEASWAGACAFDTLYGRVVDVRGKLLRRPEDELDFEEDPAIQAELARQQRDLDDLARLAATAPPLTELRSQLAELRARSSAESAAFLVPEAP